MPVLAPLKVAALSASPPMAPAAPLVTPAPKVTGLVPTRSAPVEPESPNRQ
jgi:hypothetical protein